MRFEWENTCKSLLSVSTEWGPHRPSLARWLMGLRCHRGGHQEELGFPPWISTPTLVSLMQKIVFHGQIVEETVGSTSLNHFLLLPNFSEPLNMIMCTGISREYSRQRIKYAAFLKLNSVRNLFSDIHTNIHTDPREHSMAHSSGNVYPEQRSVMHMRPWLIQPPCGVWYLLTGIYPGTISWGKRHSGVTNDGNTTKKGECQPEEHHTSPREAININPWEARPIRAPPR